MDKKIDNPALWSFAQKALKSLKGETNRIRNRGRGGYQGNISRGGFRGNRVGYHGGREDFNGGRGGYRGDREEYYGGRRGYNGGY